MNDMIELELASGHEQLEKIEALAKEIWHEHYDPIIGREQVLYMLEQFQSTQAMQQQINNGYHYYSVFLEQQLVGYTGFVYKPEHCFLSKIYIKGTQRSKGLGKKILDFIEKKVQEQGLRAIQLTVNKDNQQAILAYQRYGFSRIDAVVSDIGQGYVMDDFIFEKIL